jgi:hypothetical protein
LEERTARSLLGMPELDLDEDESDEDDDESDQE